MFKRKINPLLKPLVIAKYKDKLNAKKIERMTFLDLLFIFRKEDKKVKEWYIHHVISEWFNSLEVDSRTTFSRIKKVIWKCGIKLNDVEKHELFRLEERIFMTERGLKRLDTNIKTKKSEEVFARFEKVKLFKQQKYKTTKWKYLKEDMQNTLSITNKRFIFESEPNQSFLFANIQKYSYTWYGFKFIYNNNVYVIRIHDARTLNNIINKIFRKKVKNVVKKHENNKL